MGLVDRGRMPASLTKLFNMGRSYSMWVYQWGLACCAIEMGAASDPPGRRDAARRDPAPASPRQADLVVISGTVTDKMAPAIRRLYEQSRADVRVSMGSVPMRRAVLGQHSVTKASTILIPATCYVPAARHARRPCRRHRATATTIKNEDMGANGWRGLHARSSRWWSIE